MKKQVVGPQYRCLACGCTRLRIDVLRTVQVLFLRNEDHRLVDEEDGDTEWDDDSAASCSKCGHTGKLGQMKPADRGPRRAGEIDLAAVAVTLYFQIAPDADVVEAGMNAAQALLSRHLRDRSPGSALLDFAVGGDPLRMLLELEGEQYAVGDYTHVRMAPAPLCAAEGGTGPRLLPPVADIPPTGSNR